MARLSKNQIAFVNILRERRIGDVITEGDILKTTGWERSTFETHLSKNVFARYIQKVGGNQFRVILDGSVITPESFRDVATQVRPTQFTLHQDDSLQGAAGTYILKQKLGEGAVGHVWKARHQESGKLVAVKVMLPRQDLLAPTSIENVGRRFYRESRNGAALCHPSVIRHLDSGLFKGNPFLVMELARESLADRLKREGPLKPDDAVEVVISILDALMYLHGQKNVHRDVKPANILLCDHGYVLADLGIVKWSDLNPAFTSAATITRATVQLGSWFYMAPEQLESPHEAVAASDIYALGVSWLEILTGSPSTPAKIAARKFPPPPGHAAIAYLIDIMLAYDTEARPGLSQIRNAILTVQQIAHVSSIVPDGNGLPVQPEEPDLSRSDSYKQGQEDKGTWHSGQNPILHAPERHGEKCAGESSQTTR